MKTLKNKKNKRKTRKGGMFGRFFRRTPPQTVNIMNNIGHSITTSRYKTLKNVNALLPQNAQFIRMEEIDKNGLPKGNVASLPKMLQPFTLSKADIKKYGKVIERNDLEIGIGFLPGVSNQIVCLLMKGQKYGVFYYYRDLGSYTQYIRLPRRIKDDVYIYRPVIDVNHMTKDMQVYEIPDFIIESLGLNNT